MCLFGDAPVGGGGGSASGGMGERVSPKSVHTLARRNGCDVTVHQQVMVAWLCARHDDLSGHETRPDQPPSGLVIIERANDLREHINEDQTNPH